MSSGVIKDPPPTPVIPTSAPTQNPDSVYRGLIECPPIACRITEASRASDLQQPRDVFRHNPGGWTVNAFDEKSGAMRGFEVEFDRAGAGATGFFDKARRRLDSPRRADCNKHF